MAPKVFCCPMQLLLEIYLITVSYKIDTNSQIQNPTLATLLPHKRDSDSSFGSMPMPNFPD